MGGINCILIENLLTVLMCAAKHSRPEIRAVEENYLAVEGTWAFLFTCCLKDPLRWTYFVDYILKTGTYLILYKYMLRNEYKIQETLFYVGLCTETLAQ